MEILILWVIGYLFTFGAIEESEGAIPPTITSFFVLFFFWPVALGNIIGKKL